MFNLTDNFQVRDENAQPYSFSVERHTEIRDLHAAIDERGFSLKSIGNRFILNTPELNTFSFKMTFCYTFMEEYNPTFNVFFGYDKKNRCGFGLQLVYSLSGSMKISYIKVDRMKINVIRTLTLEECVIKEEGNVTLCINFDGCMLCGSVGGSDFSFAAEKAYGKLAIERKNFIGELILKEISVTSEDEFKEEILLPEQTVEIPLTDGGDISYKFSFSVKKTNEMCYLNTKLFGGTASRKVNREDRPGQYVVERDLLTSPFVIVRNNEKEEKFFIFNGRKIICDPNIFWECQKRFLGHPNLPIQCRFVLDEGMITQNSTISYGYEYLKCTGYNSQEDGPSEYVFSADGKMLYAGQALGESIFDLYSPEDKFATTLIGENTYKRDEVLNHLKNNHYFHIDEDVNFTFSVKTRLNPKYVTIKAEIRDVYDSETLFNLDASVSVGKWKFGYSEIKAEVCSKPMPLGVYRIVFTVFYGDGIYRCFNKIFEAFDKESTISPAKASGLPYVFSMPNEHKWLMRNTFDLWNPKPSCDVGHFISCVTDTPIEAETRHIWEVIKPFGREWFAWLSNRTCRDWSIESHPDVVKHSDYLYIPAKTEVFPLRNDLYLAKTYQNPEFRKYLHEFLNENPEIREKLLYKEKQESDAYEENAIFDESGIIPVYKNFTYEHLKDLLDTCHAEWFRFANKKLLENFKKQNKEIKKINPNFKRSAYGPFNNYVTPALSYHTIKAFGNLPYESLSDEVYTGFAVFEDYPASCAYQTYRGSFAVMTILLHCPGLTIYPEQYKGEGIGGCIDGAVKFSHAPMGAYIMPPYFNTTHAFEFVFNTPHKTKDGYSYWNTYGFHRPDFPPKLWDTLVKGWKTAITCSPKKPLRSMAMITEYYEEEDIYDDGIINFHGHTNLYNTSEEAHGYIYECTREAGLNAPFAMKFDALPTLSSEECDVLVLPTLHYADENSKKEIRRLYNEGVALFAVSNVDGLEDIFGIKSRDEKRYIRTLCTDSGETEDIYPNDAVFKYEPDKAEVILWADDGIPVLMKYNRAVILNAAVSTLGHECFEGAAGKGRKNVSTLFRNVVKDTLKSISNPLIKGENVGVTLFEDKKGISHILCIDYSPYENEVQEEKTVIVKINIKAKSIQSDREFVTVRDENGNICELRFNIKVHEAVMFTLK